MPRARDYEDEDRPRRKKRPSSSGGKGPWIAAAIAAGVLLIAGVIVIVVVSGKGTDGGGGTSGPDGAKGGGKDPKGDGDGILVFGRIPASMQAYLPNDTFQIKYAHVQNQLKAFGGDRSQVRAPPLPDLKDFENDFGPLENVAEAVWGLRS